MLFDYFVEVESVVENGNVDDIRNIVKKLLDYAVWHNEFEEGLMTEAGYPMTIPHGKIHEATETTEVKKAPKANPKPITAKYECELCGKPIYDSPRIIRCTELTGFALYYRSIQDQYKVCNECGKEFNDMVEKWLIKKGAKLRAGYLDKNIDKKDKD